MSKTASHSVLPSAFKYSLPVLFGYTAIGTAFGLLMADAGYPWWLSLLMSIVMYAGAGQFIAVGLFAAGVGIFEAALVQFVLNSRHIAYSMSMLNRYNKTGKYKPYLIFSLTDETFALLSSLPETGEKAQKKLMFYTSLLNQFYWIAGTIIGAVTGSLIPFNTEGIGFALTAMFVVLMIEKILPVKPKIETPSFLNKKKELAVIFLVSAAVAILTVIIFPIRFSLPSALLISILICFVLDNKINSKMPAESS